jgi:hypothetical protein
MPPRPESTSELWDGSPGNVTVDNRHFEDVSFSLVDVAIIGDQRMLDSSSLGRMKPSLFHAKTVAIISAILSEEACDIDVRVRRILDGF